MVKFSKLLRQVSDPETVSRRARKIFGRDVDLRESDSQDKKYMIWDPIKEKWVHFGNLNYEDYTYHRDPERRRNYLARSGGIAGNWKKNAYSPNNLARKLLW